MRYDLCGQMCLHWAHQGAQYVHEVAVRLGVHSKLVQGNQLHWHKAAVPNG